MLRNKNPNHKTFIIAAMIILLCFVCLTGATFALFTSTSDGKIGINATSGSVKVDIVDTSDEPESLVGKVLDFMTTSNKNEILFEPGATYYTEGFRVQNNSSIPVNFLIYISEDETVSAEFFEAFDVWLTTDPSDRYNMEKMQEFRGELAVGQTSGVYYLVFHMKEDATNEFKNQTFTGVGITVCAVQGNGYID